MLGTLNGALEVREVHLEPEDMSAEVEGINEVRDGVPVLTEVRISYTLRIPEGSRETVERALERHQSKCPTARTLEGSVEIGWSADIREK